MRRQRRGRRQQLLQRRRGAAAAPWPALRSHLLTSLGLSQFVADALRPLLLSAPSFAAVLTAAETFLCRHRKAVTKRLPLLFGLAPSGGGATRSASSIMLRT
jgi:hypothetical protein